MSDNPVDPDANGYYEYIRNILPGGIARSEPIIEQFNAIQQAFALLPSPIKDTQGTRGFSETFPIPDAVDDANPATWRQVTDPELPIARLPMRRRDGEMGFAQPLPIPPARNGNHAATYGQVQEQRQAMQAAEARTLSAAQQATQSESNAQNSYSAAQAIYDVIASAQAQINALMNLGIGASYVDSNGDLIMTFNDATVDDVIINADGYLTITY